MDREDHSHNSSSGAGLLSRPGPWLRFLDETVGWLLAMLGGMWFTTSSESFVPWRPALPELSVWSDASLLVLSNLPSLYAGETPFTGPPFAALLGVGAASITAGGWVILNVAAIMLLIRMTPLRGWRAGLVAVVVMGLEPLNTVLNLGSPLLIIMTLVVLDVAGTPVRRLCWLTGIPTGLAIACQPYLVVMLGVLWASRRTERSTDDASKAPEAPGPYRAVLTALITAASCTLLAALVAPRDTVRFFDSQLWTLVTLQPDAAGQLENQSLVNALVRGGGAPPVAQLVAWAVAAAMLILAMRFASEGQCILAVGVAGLAVCTALPVMWPYDPVWIWPLLAGLLGSHRVGLTRMVGLIWGVFLIVQPWRLLPIWAKGEPLTGIELVGAGLGGVLAVVWTLAALAAAGPLPRLRESWRSALYCAVPVVACLWVAGTYYAPSSTLVPWEPVMHDFGVYLSAGEALRQGADIYATEGWPFLYPPFAALLAAAASYHPILAKAVWQVASGLLILAVVHRVGISGWRGAIVAGSAIVINTTLAVAVGIGNIQLLLTALIVLDLTSKSGSGDRRLTGVCVGLLTAIKIIPGLFIVLLFLTRRWRAAWTATATAAGATLLGLVVLPRETVEFTRMVLTGALNDGVEGGLVHFLSLVSALQRFLGYQPNTETILTMVSALVGMIGLVAAVRWHGRGREVYALSLCGTATIFFSPIAWNHYYVWLLPAALVVAHEWWQHDQWWHRPRAARWRVSAWRDRPQPSPWIPSFVLSVLLVWSIFQFHLAVPNGNEQWPPFSSVQKLIAGFLPFGTAVWLILSAMIIPGQRDDFARPERRQSVEEHVTPEGTRRAGSIAASPTIRHCALDTVQP